MKAAVIEGGELVIRDVPDPAIGPGHVLVRVRATALNRADLLQRRGLYPAPPGAPADIPGLEFAGVVERTGDGVKDWEPGDRVMGLLGGGGYAGKVTLPAAHLLPIPGKFSFQQAAAVPEVFLTAFDALLRLDPKKGEQLLIHAVASGVGSAAVQLARVWELRTLGTSSSAPKLELAAGLGLQHPINYREQDFPTVVKEITGGKGVEMILDLVGAAHWSGNLESLSSLGRMILVGLVGGAQVETDLRKILQKRLSIYGTVLRSRSDAEKAELTRHFAQQVLPLFDSGAISPVIDCVFPLEQASQAHQLMESNKNAGKIVLKVS